MILKHLLWKLYHMEENTNALDLEISQDQTKMEQLGVDGKKLDKELKLARKEVASTQKDLLQAEQSVKQYMKEKESMIPEKLKLKEQLSFKRTKVEKVSSQLEISQQELQVKEDIVVSKERDLAIISKELEEFEGKSCFKMIKC